MSLSEEERSILIGLEIEKAHEMMEDTELLIDKNRWSSAANRLYYAIFHCICALFIHDGYKVKSHKGVSVMFNQHYINTQKVPQEYGQMLSQLESMREEGDYNCHYKVDSRELSEKITIARQMIDTIETMVK